MPVVTKSLVQFNGDQAIQALAKSLMHRPDRIEVDYRSKSAQNELSADLKAAIDKAYNNIYAFPQSTTNRSSSA